MHWEHVFGSKYLLFYFFFFFYIFPCLIYREYIIALVETISLAHLTSIPLPGFRKDFILVSHCVSPQCLKAEDDVAVSLVLFSKYAHLSFFKKKLFSLKIWGNAFSLAALTNWAS